MLVAITTLLAMQLLGEALARGLGLALNGLVTAILVPLVMGPWR